MAGHECAHALHHKALGGMWWLQHLDYREWTCFSHWFTKITTTRCALQEGFAQYAGKIGTVSADYPDGYYGWCFEHFGDPTVPVYPPRPARDTTAWGCREKAYYRQKPKIEGHVAAFLHDLTDDDDNERGDYTEYPGLYVAMIFKTCKVKNRYWTGWLPGVGNIYMYKWWKMTNVSNIVWCLGEPVDGPVHEDVFWMVRTPVDVKHGAKEHKPVNWKRSDIRSTWTKNLKSY